MTPLGLPGGAAGVEESGEGLLAVVGGFEGTVGPCGHHLGKFDCV